MRIHNHDLIVKLCERFGVPILNPKKKAYTDRYLQTKIFGKIKSEFSNQIQGKKFKDSFDLLQYTDNALLKDSSEDELELDNEWVESVEKLKLNKNLKNFDVYTVYLADYGRQITSIEMTSVVEDLLSQQYGPQRYNVKNVLVRVFNNNNLVVFASRDVDQTYKKLREDIERAYLNSLKDSDGENLEASRFIKIEIIVELIRGGCLLNNDKVMKIDNRLQSKGYLYIPTSEDNNCLLEILTLSVGFPTCKETNKQNLNKIRQKLNIPINELISVDQISLLTKYFKCNVELYTFNNWEFKLHRSIIESSEFKTVYIAYYESHYYWIKNQELVHYVRCKKCYKQIKGIESHNCNICPKCGKKNDEKHNKRDCKIQNRQVKKNRSKFDGFITAKSKDEKFDAFGENIHFTDFETFPSDKGEHQPYAVGIKHFSEKTYIYYGQDTLDKFMEVLMQLASEKKKQYLVMYNSGRFDAVFIMKQFFRRDDIDKNQVKFIYSNGSLKKVEYKNLIIFDLYLHIQCSLKDACKAFNCDIQKGEFDHKLIRSWDDVPTHKKDWELYLEKDVDSMAELYQKYVQTIWDNFQMNANKYITLSSLAEAIWKTTLHEDIKIKIPTYEHDQFIRRALYGARTLPFKKQFISKNEDDYLVDLDVISLYPTAMLNYFPTDYEVVADQKRLDKLLEMIQTNQVQDMDYIIECDIEIPKALLLNVLPRKYPDGISEIYEGGVGWSDMSSIEKQCYTSVDIKRALIHNYKVKKIYRAFVFKRSSKVFENYIHTCYKWKQESVKGTPQYTVAKLLMNSLYGKSCQRPINQKYMCCSSMEDYYKIINSEGIITDYHLLKDSSGEINSIIFVYKNKNADECVNKASYHGAFILAYSKQIMDVFFNKAMFYSNLHNLCYYSDTDSMIVHKDVYEKYLKEYYNPGQLGMLDFDISGQIIKYYGVAPKCYAVEYINNKKEIKMHIRSKGIPYKSQQLLTMEDFRRMIHDEDYLIKVTTKPDEESREITCDKTLKRLNFKLNSTNIKDGRDIFTIYESDFERSINVSKFQKRKQLHDEHLSTVPYDN